MVEAAAGGPDRAQTAPCPSPGTVWHCDGHTLHSLPRLDPGRAWARRGESRRSVTLSAQGRLARGEEGPGRTREGLSGHPVSTATALPAF